MWANFKSMPKLLKFFTIRIIPGTVYLIINKRKLP